MGYGLYGKTVIITGASGGFGSELTELLINEYGCRVIGIGRTKEKLEALSDRLGRRKNAFRYFTFDVTDEAAFSRFASILEKADIIPDVYISNAGVMPPLCFFENRDKEEAESVMNTNFTSLVYGARYMIPLLLRSDKGAFISIASSAADSPLAGAALYCASKAANKSFTLALSEEYEGRLYIASVCPGVSDTELFRGSRMTEYERRVLRSVGTDKRDVARAIAKGIEKGRRIISIGKDCRVMTAFSRLLPDTSARVYGGIITGLPAPVFSQVHIKR